MYSCQAIEGEQICLPRDPVQASAVVGAYLNKRAKICADRKHHDFPSGRPITARYPVAGKPDCEKVVKQKKCKTCLSNIAIAIGYDGDCGDLPPVTSCE